MTRIQLSASRSVKAAESDPAGKSFEADFCTVARWSDDGEIIEENLFYDIVGMMRQRGIGA